MEFLSCRPFRAIVLLSAYGASPYLSAQVASISAQLTQQDLLVLVDDGSRAVCWEALQAVLPANYLCWSRLRGQGSSASFLNLLLCDAPEGQYYFLADQDDLWLPGKLEGQLAATPKHGMTVHAWQVWNQADPHCSGAALPMLDAHLQEAPLPQASAAHYFFETPAPGMTMCIGHVCRVQLQCWVAVLAVSAAALPHDRILAAAVSTVGPVHVLPTPWVLYRQHGGNLIGAPKENIWERVGQRLWRLRRMWRSLCAGAALYQALRAWGGAVALPAAPWRLRLRSGWWDDWLARGLVWCVAVGRRGEKRR